MSVAANLHLVEPSNSPEEKPGIDSVKRGVGNVAGANQSPLKGVAPPKIGTVPPKANETNSRIRALLKFEQAIRSAPNIKALAFSLASDSRDLFSMGQALVFREKSRHSFVVEAVCGSCEVNADAPLVRWLTRQMSQISKEQKQKPTQSLTINLGNFPGADSAGVTDFPFKNALLVPMERGKHGMFGAVMYLRTEPWQAQDVVIADRMRETAAHAWVALKGGSGLRRRFSLNLYAALLCLLLIAVSFIPVPLRVLAPFEITPVSPSLVTAPLSGTLKDIAVDPNTKVAKGDLLFTYETTDFSNEYLLSERRLAVVNAKRRRLEQTAITNREAKAELASAQADQKLALAERDYSLLKLQKMEVRARTAGLLVYSNKKDWLGKPLQVGERVMQIADPSAVEVTIDLPVADDIVLKSGLKARFFFNSAPLNSLEGKVHRVSRIATQNGANELVYQMQASLNEGENSQAQALIGNRGVAQIEGETVSLFFFVMRKPITAARQFFGF